MSCKALRRWGTSIRTVTVSATNVADNVIAGGVIIIVIISRHENKDNNEENDDY